MRDDLFIPLFLGVKRPECGIILIKILLRGVWHRPCIYQFADINVYCRGGGL